MKIRQLVRFLTWFWLGNTLLFAMAGLRFLKTILASDTLFETSFAAYHSLAGKGLVLAFTFASYLGHFSLLAALPLFLIVLPLVLIFRQRYLLFSISILVSSVSLALLFTDSYIFSLFHFHLNKTIFTVFFAENNDFVHFIEMTTGEVLFIIISGGFVLITESLLAFLIWKKIVLKNRWRIEKKLAFLFPTSLVFSYLIVILSVTNGNNIFIQQTPTLPLYNQCLASFIPIKNSFAILERLSETRFSQPLFATGRLNYPLKPLHFIKQTTAYNILIISIDTWRFDSVTPEIMPFTYQFAKHTWQFNKHYSGGNSTQPGLFSLFYSLPSNYWSAMQDQKQAPLFFQTLKNNHYQTKIMFSSDMIPPFNKNIFINLPDLRTKHADGDTIPDHDRSITNEFTQFLSSRKKNSPFFAFLFYDAAHGYCSSQNINEVFKTNGMGCDRLALNGVNISNIKNRYLNALHFVDGEVNKVLSELSNKHLLDKTIIIITGDHGEEFNDSGQDFVGHASNYTRYQLQTPLIISWPHQHAKTFQHQTSHYDIIPTLMTNAFACQTNPSDYSIGKLLTNTNEQAYLLAGSYMNMAIIEKNKSITLQTSGHIHVTDNQARDLPDTIDLHLLDKALADMRRFFVTH